ncbi:hypothetical protein D3C86_1821240 [compost metagenome]
MGLFAEFAQFAIQTVDFRHLQYAPGHAQPDQQALDARQLFGQVFRLLLVAVQLQVMAFLGQQGWQPVAQRCGALAIAAVVACGRPALGQQPA